MEDYAIRSSKELEDKILKIGPEKVCCFVGETMAGVSWGCPSSKQLLEKY